MLQLRGQLAVLEHDVLVLLLLAHALAQVLEDWQGRVVGLGSGPGLGSGIGLGVGFGSRRSALKMASAARSKISDGLCAEKRPSLPSASAWQEGGGGGEGAGEGEGEREGEGEGEGEDEGLGW